MMRLIKQIQSERNLNESTCQGYRAAILKYEQFNKMSIRELIDEAISEEKKPIAPRDRKIKKRLIEYRSYLISLGLESASVKNYLTKIKTIYRHFGIEIPYIPPFSYSKSYEVTYDDLPSREHIRIAVEMSNALMQAVILFMASSGTARAETLSLSVGDFIKATDAYHDGGDVETVLETLSRRDDVIPTFYLKRIKTDKYYHTFTTPEAVSFIVKYLKTRPDLKSEDKLFDISKENLIKKFNEINDKNEWGFKGSFRFFRSHCLRKFHASNANLSAEIVDSMQGRSKTKVHDAYIKKPPKDLKEIYMEVMQNFIIFKSKK